MIRRTALQTLNGHLLCAIDTETSGLVAGYHDILEVAVVPLDAYFEPLRDVMPFVTLLKPKMRYEDSITPEALKVNGLKIEDLMIHGVDPYRAADLFETWLERFALAPGKKVAPLTKNWPFDKAFIMDWLGPKTFESLFWHRVRDLQSVVHYLNDKAEWVGEKPPFPQTALEHVRSYLKIPPRMSHRALDDAIITAQCYAKIMRGDIPSPDDR